MSPQPTSPNFSFLAADNPQLVHFAALAERYFTSDPATCIFKLRQFAEALAQLTAARSGLLHDTEEPQADLLRRLFFERLIPQRTADLFHHLRKAGNNATHRNQGTHSDALTALKIARELGVWFHNTFGTAKSFSPGPFTPPPDPAAATQALAAELSRLRSELETHRAAAEQHERARLTAEQQAQRDREEKAVWEQLAAEAGQAAEHAAQQAQAAQLQLLQSAAAQQPAAQLTASIAARAERAAAAIDLDEPSTRALIDEQLRAQGWEADTPTLRHSAGSRPAKGRNLAIAEWPTASGPADYALFAGTRCLAVVEAKRRNKNVSAHIDQAERYARTILLESEAAPISAHSPYLVPFAFSANGRAYLKQLETESGIWFRDLRRPANHRRALNGWPTPDGLLATLEIDLDRAADDLHSRSFDFGFPLRPYQRQAIETVESELARGRRSMLLAMATGTGKTKLAIAMLYRLLAAKRFRRVCFVVDRNALGKQAAGEFSTTRVVSTKTFSDTFGLKGLELAQPDPETKVHICTIQGLVQRVLYASAPPPVDQYDLIVVDECHRGYLLDRELSTAELAFRSQDDYVSKYRRVLEHFDAVKIGLTATPALHTVNIFGDPVFTYSYREAVIDGYLIDHGPPTQITTALSRAGIRFDRGEQLELLDTKTGHIDLARAPDEIKFEVDEFNKSVITVAFNRAVAEELARHIDPSLPGKTLVFAATDLHADLVVTELKAAFRAAYGEIDDAAIRKITGSVDRPNDLILSFRNDALPKIAVTVDLLTTGIDVPSILNLVFLRRVNSRILYEQMLGRATRQCPEIGKETFRIFDAVDLYPHLQNLTQMKPVVVDPAVTLEQLFEEFARVESEDHRREVRDQILVKLRRRLGRLNDQARALYESEAGEPPETTLQRLAEQPTAAMAAWVKQRPALGGILDWNPDRNNPHYLPVSPHPDRVLFVTSGYGQGQRPADFLDSFAAFIRDNINRIAALNIVLQRPRDLTRADLKSLSLALARHGYTEPTLRQAWSEAKNEEIAASIVGFIRQAALGDSLIPMDQRVNAAMKRIFAKHPWTGVQRKWLKRIADQILRESVVDRAAIDEEPFRADGGYQRLNKIFEGRLDSVLSDINEELWKRAA
jgi:type I restriction enzyme R subunit